MPITIVQKGQKKERIMGALSLHSIELLRLTKRKADLEYNISINAMEKMALAREQSNLTREYQAALQGKNISYYAGGKYNQMTYGYLMGYGVNTMLTMSTNPECLKKDNSMILTDSRGLVVMSDQYANILAKILGSSCMDAKGRGGTFSTDKIPAIIAAIAGSPLTEENVKEVMDGQTLDYNYNSTVRQTTTLNQKGSTTTDGSGTYTEMIKKLVDFYAPIFQAAAANGWTKEYNECMAENDNYISDALVSGMFQLAQVGTEGSYDPDTSLTYFVYSGAVSDRSDAHVREEITAKYNAEKEEIAFKEDMIDLETQDLSTELEATNTELESIKSLLEDDMSIFEWCT